MSRDVLKRVGENGPLIQTTSVEKTNLLRYLYREGDKGNRVLETPCHSVTSNLKSFHGEVCF